MPSISVSAGTGGVAAVCRVLIALISVGGFILVALLGGLLNRGRGGFITFGPQNSSDPEHEQWYWPAHVLSRLLFAAPTGLLVLLCGLHLRASFIVMVMTWFSLYVGWGCYMGIGTVDNVDSRSGVFDWILGRQEANWTMGQRFVREYAGMSLRGLIWTLPQGYVLERFGFGWEYSLSGSLMGLIYYVGANTDTSAFPHQAFFVQGTAAAEVYWGWWMWFVLSMVSLSQLVRRGQLWVCQKSPYLGLRPYSPWESIKYLSLNRPFCRLNYELFVCFFNIILCCSIMFYSLIEQTDVRNKAQTFFGVLTAVLLLCFSQGWVWSLLYLNIQLKKMAKKVKTSCTQEQIFTSSSQAFDIRSSLNPSPDRVFRNATSHIDDLDRYEATAAVMNGETQPLLSWPYSHPDRVSPTGERINTLKLPEGNPSVSKHVRHVMQPPATSTACLILWPSIDKWLWLDVFVLVRRLIGLVSFLSTILTLVLTLIAVIWDIESPRFVHVPSSIFVVNLTVPEF